jgi:hypothetical protein
MIQPIRSLRDLERHGGSIHAECQTCGRVAIIAVSDLLAHFRRRHLPMNWPHFAEKLRCLPPAGCGANNPNLSWYGSMPPPDDNQPPPRPRFVRNPALPGIDQNAWERAKSNRHRRSLIRLAGG